ncbi:MAG: mannan-binding lectin [Proteobacteria bacterium]|nr:mannan-binding lectin [Pseudomonadota bacterium]
MTVAFFAFFTGTSSVTADTPKAATGVVHAVNAGPIFDQAEAQVKCPTVCQAPSRWNGGWRTIKATVMSQCDCVDPLPAAPPPPHPAKLKVRPVVTEAIWSNSDAKEKCAKVCTAPLTWAGGWRTIKRNQTSECDCLEPPALAATPVGTPPSTTPVGTPPSTTPVGTPPSTQWPGFEAGYPDLPARFEALLVKGMVDRAELLGTARGPLAASDGYVLLVPGQHGRTVLLAKGARLTAVEAKQFGVDATAAIVEVERDVTSPSCTAQTPTNVCVRKLRRLDGGATYAIDISKVLTELITRYQPTATDGKALASRARTLVAAAGAHSPNFRELAFVPSWSSTRHELEVLVVARAERVTTHRELSRDPQAGSVGCEAPPGADCAPRCRPPAFQVTSTEIAEAGIRAVFDHSGAAVKLGDAGAGMHPPRMLGSKDEPCR